MTAGISHLFVSAKADGADATLVQPSNWNATHVFNDLNFLSNLLINPDFRINQMAYVSGAALAAGAYGHDQWKGGAAGGDYSFTQLKTPTQITIAANKSIIQVANSDNVASTAYALSWTGTAVARYAVNSATPAGNFAVSPITITGQTIGSALSVEFTGANAVGGSSIATNTGTLGPIKLEAGSIATPFLAKSWAESYLECLEYFETNFPYGTAPADGSSAACSANAGLSSWFSYTTASMRTPEFVFRAQKRAAPTMTRYASGVTGISTAGHWGYFTSSWQDAGTPSLTASLREFYASTSGLSVTQGINFLVSGFWTADARI